MGRNSLKFNNEELLKKVIKECYNKTQCLLKLDINPGGGNFKTLDKYILKYKIDISHFTLKGFKKGNIPFNKKDALEYCYNGNKIKSHHLKLALYRDGYKEKKCEKCGIENWMDEELPFELDHIDGNKYNNELINLQILCPNCHSIKTRKQCIRKYENHKKLIKDLDLNKTITKLKLNNCKNCNNKTENKSFCSIDCQKKYNRRNIPLKNELEESIEKIGKNFSAIGRYFNVTDNTVRQWFKKYNISLK